VLINPLVYVSDGMRAALTPGVPHMLLLLLILAALVVLTVLFMALGLRAFDKRAMS
jgi:ABC-2 type transport system permease protein